jgi:putative ABC transport system permease protein
VTRILFRAGARYHLRHPLQLALALLGVTLGVTVVAAVDVATASARRAFTLSAEAVTGRATHEIVGGPAGIADTLYTALRVGLGMDSVAPVLDRYIRLPQHGGRTVRLLGVDPFAEAPFRPYVAPAAGQLDIGALLTRRAVLLEAGTAADLGIEAGETVLVDAGSHASAVLIAGVLQPADALARRALADLALTDIATAQEILGAPGVLDRIELRVAESPAGAARLAAVRAALPAGARLLEAEARAGATVRLTRAFETNLHALALVALVFGMFLIYNSVTFSLLQRRPLFGLLRAQGVTAREVFTLVLLEAAVLGTAATALGLLLGVALGGELVRLVARTINDLYFTVSVTAVLVGAPTLLKAAALGIGATVLAALPPAAEAVRTRPRAALARATLERGARGMARRLALAGAATALVAAAALAVPSRSLLLGFGALFVLILSAALVTPAATTMLMALVRPFAAMLGPVERMAARGVTASLSRTAPAIAALAVALAVGIAVTIMIGSFRAGVVRWLDQSLQADLYVAAPELGASRTDVTLAAGLPAAITALPGVAGTSTYRHVSLLLGADLVRLIAIDMYPPHQDAFQLLDTPRATAWRAFHRGGILVSEPFAYRHAVAAGDSVTLPTDRGPVSLPVAAVYRDYASEHGIVFIDRAAYDAFWDDDDITSVGVFLADIADAGSAGAGAGAGPGAGAAAGAGAARDAHARSAAAVLTSIRALPGGGGVVVRSNRELRAATLAVFDRTFAITSVLRLLALIVAFVGVTGALMALQLERGREIGVLRATGLTPAQVWALVTTQTGLMGLAAAALAAPLGLAMAWAMVHVINRRAFGWTFDMLVGAAPFAQALAVGTAAALLAGIYPAWRMARLRPAEALREWVPGTRIAQRPE